MSLVGFRAKTHPQQGSKASVDDRATDPIFFGRLDGRFDFTVDVCATAENTKCKRFFTVEDDGLAQSWAGESVWCNPPFSNIRPWVEKAWLECVRARRIVMLVPANRTEQVWWQELVEPYRDKKIPGSHYGFVTEFLPGRLRFIPPGASRVGEDQRPSFGCVLLIWRGIAARPAGLNIQPLPRRLPL